MTLSNRIIRAAIRYAKQRYAESQRRRRQRQLAAALPSIVYRGKQIALAKKHHRPCKHLIAAQCADMTAQLRREVGV